MTKQEALETAGENLCKEVESIICNLDAAMDDVKESVLEGSAGRFMEVKGKILKTLMTYRVVSGVNCPYCMYYSYIDDNGTTLVCCKECEYGKKGGRCHEGGSVWKNLVTKIREINPIILEYSSDCPEIEEEQKRVLKIGNAKIDGDSITFQIVEQSHRNKEFCEDGDTFTSSGNFVLTSDASPAVYSFMENLLNVRGYDKSADDVVMTVDLKKYVRIIEAIKEYNNGRIKSV